MPLNYNYNPIQAAKKHSPRLTVNTEVNKLGVNDSLSDGFRF